MNRRILAAALGGALSAAAAEAGVEVRPYGTLSDGRAVCEYVLTNGRGATVRFIGYGGIITAIEVPDREGKSANLVLALPDLASYEHSNGDYLGAIVGRFAGRIAGARFTLDGREYRLRANDGENTLHGGAPGLEARLWRVEPFERGDVVGAVLRYTSPAGEQGFPGELHVKVTYSLLPSNALQVDYEAATSEPTVLNLTQHSYFNLGGAGSGTVLDHLLQVPATHYVETFESGIPTGGLQAVAGTPFDFTALRPIGGTIGAEHPQMEGRRGYNHSWILPSQDGALQHAARLAEPRSGRVLDIYTTEPSVHIYTGNYLGGRYAPYQGIALETQHLPDSPNQPHFPTTVLRPGETFRSTTIFAFGLMPEEGR
ncbi:MAG: galactose mutarotase [Pseudomonadota bacterium]|nr:galactose mutarotase [Pseudomonadota bacterium]